MNIPYVQILLMLFFSIVILGLCYIIIKNTLKKEREKQLPNQLKAVRELFGENDLEIVVKIDKKGNTKIEGFDLKEQIDYAQ